MGRPPSHFFTSIEDFPRTLTRLRSLKAQDVTEAYTAKLDISREASLFGAQTVFTAGVRYDDRTKTANEDLLELNSAAQFAAAGIPTGYAAIAKTGGFQGEIPLGYTFQYFDRDKVLGLVRKLDGLASDRGQSLAQLALAWVLRDERVTSVLIGASSVAQLEDNAACVDDLGFPDEELAQIDEWCREAGYDVPDLTLQRRS